MRNIFLLVGRGLTIVQQLHDSGAKVSIIKYDQLNIKYLISQVFDDQ